MLATVESLKGTDYASFVCVLLEMMKNGIKVMDIDYIKKFPILGTLPSLDNMAFILSDDRSYRPIRKVKSIHVAIN